MNRQFLFLSAALVCCALFACKSAPARVPSPVDEEYQRLEAAARNAHSRGELSYAADLYSDLLTEAERTDDPSKIGDSCYNLAVCRLAQGEWDPAREMLVLAEHELLRAGEPLAQVFIARARLELLAGDPQACGLAADAAITQQASRPSANELSAAYVLTGLAALKLERVDRAEAALAKAKGASQDPAALPSILRLSARIAASRADWKGAAARYDLEADTNRKLSSYDAMALSLELAGDAWQAAGDAQQAGDRWLRAARARFAQAVRRDSPPPRALEQLKTAAQLCQRLDDEQRLAADPVLRARVRNLVERMEAERVRLQGYLLDAQAARGLPSPPTVNSEQ